MTCSMKTMAENPPEAWFVCKFGLASVNWIWVPPTCGSSLHQMPWPLANRWVGFGWIYGSMEHGVGSFSAELYHRNAMCQHIYELWSTSHEKKPGEMLNFWAELCTRWEALPVFSFARRRPAGSCCLSNFTTGFTTSHAYLVGSQSHTCLNMFLTTSF